MIEHREVVRLAVRGYLLEQHPERIAEFDAVFESVYRAILRAEDKGGATRAREGAAELSFAAGAGEGAIVALACYVGCAALKAILKKEVPKVLASAKPRLSELTGRPELVSAIFQRIEDILKEV